MTLEILLLEGSPRYQSARLELSFFAREPIILNNSGLILIRTFELFLF